MTYLGTIKNGQILLPKDTQLPEGASVQVEVLDSASVMSALPPRKKLRDITPIEMEGGPLSDDIIRDRR